MADDISNSTLSDPALLTPAEAAPGVEQFEMPSIEKFDWMNKKIYPILVQAAIICAVVLTGVAGWTATLAAGAAMMAFELGRAHFSNKADLNRELTLYHDDIARVLGKAPEAVLTIEDMRKAADEKYVGDKALKPLQMELKHLEYRGRYNMVMGAAWAMVTTTAAMLLGGSMKGVIDHVGASGVMEAGSHFYGTLTSALFGIGTTTMVIENLGKMYFDSHKPPSVYKDLVQLKETARQRVIEPEQVFAVTIKLDKELAQDIESRFGKPYEKLTYRNKQRIIKACEERSHTLALTQGINEGLLPVTAIALNAFHQLEWSKPAPMKEQLEESTLSKAAELSSRINMTVRPFVERIGDKNSASLSRC